MKKRQLNCHPEATIPYLLSKKMFIDLDHQESIIRINLIINAHPLKYICTDDQNENFFAGWASLDWQGSIVARREDKTRNRINKREIQLCAWRYLLTLILILSEKKDLVSNLIKFLDAIPEDLIRYCFHRKLPNSRVKQVMAISGLKRQAVRHQLRKLEANNDLQQ